MSRICLGLENQLSNSTYFALCPAPNAVFSKHVMTSVAFWQAISRRRPEIVILSILLCMPRMFSSLFEDSKEELMGRKERPSVQPMVSNLKPLVYRFATWSNTLAAYSVRLKPVLSYNESSMTKQLSRFSDVSGRMWLLIILQKEA